MILQAISTSPLMVQEVTGKDDDREAAFTECWILGRPLWLVDGYVSFVFHRFFDDFDE